MRDGFVLGHVWKERDALTVQREIHGEFLREFPEISEFPELNC